VLALCPPRSLIATDQESYPATGIGLSGFGSLGRCGDTPWSPTLLEKEEGGGSDAIEALRLEASALHRSHVGHPCARSGCSIQASLGLKERMHMLRKFIYSLGALAMLAMAVGAGFKPA
jgi:hypothetical protein